MCELLVIADDFTGAADTAVQLVKCGVPACVCLYDSLHPEADSRYRAMVIDTESRHLEPGEAAERVTDAVGAVLSRSIKAFYKKIDSTFRGNVGAEIEAFMNACGEDRVMLVPSYPSAGRVTRGGYQYVNGVPVNESPYGRDPADPVKESHIPSLLSRQTSVPVHCFTTDKNGELFTKGIHVFDGSTDDDVAAVARRLGACGALKLCAGTALFAGLLPPLLGIKQSVLENKRPSAGAEPLLIVNGSLNRTALDQVNRAGAEGLQVVRIPPEFLTGSHVGVDRLWDGLDMREHIVITGALDDTDRITCKRIDQARICGNIAAAASGLFDKMQKSSVVVFGGDTAAAMFKLLKCRAYIPVQEILPGLAYGTAEGENYTIPMITKSGGFGPVDIISRIIRFMRGS